MHHCYLQLKLQSTAQSVECLDFESRGLESVPVMVINVGLFLVLSGTPARIQRSWDQFQSLLCNIRNFIMHIFHFLSLKCVADQHEKKCPLHHSLRTNCYCPLGVGFESI